MSAPQRMILRSARYSQAEIPKPGSPELNSAARAAFSAASIADHRLDVCGGDDPGVVRAVRHGDWYLSPAQRDRIEQHAAADKSDLGDMFDAGPRIFSTITSAR